MTGITEENNETSVRIIDSGPRLESGTSGTQNRRVKHSAVAFL